MPSPSSPSRTPESRTPHSPDPDGRRPATRSPESPGTDTSAATSTSSFAPPAGPGAKNGDTPGRARPGAVLAVVVTAYLMVGVDASVVNVALPDIQRDLRFSATGLSWVLNAYTLTFGGLLLLGGRIGDIAGRRRTLRLGTALFGIASLLGGLAPQSGLLLAARACQGVGAALIAPSTLSLITLGFAEGRPRNRALSVYSSVASIGATVGLVLGGTLTAWASWRWALLINVPIAAAVALVLPRVVPESARRTGRFDAAGAVTGTLGTGGLVYAFIRVSDAGWSDARALVSFAAAAVLLAGFTAVERRARQPIAPLRLFAHRDRAGAYAGVLLIPAGMFSAFYFLTLFVQQVLGYGPLRAGAAFLPLTVAAFVVLRFVAGLVQRFGARPVLVAGTALIATAELWLARLDAADGYAAGLLGPLVLLGLGTGLVFMPLNATILAGTGPEEVGAASGLLQTLQWLGGTLGLAVLVTAFGTAARHASGTPHEAMTTGMNTAFGIGALIAVTALLITGLVIRGDGGGATRRGRRTG